MEDIILLGIGGHAKGIVDTIEKQKKYRIVGFIEPPARQNQMYKQYNVIGTDDDLENIFKYGGGIRFAFVTVGYLGESRVRDGLYKKLKTIGYQLPVIIDDTAAVAQNAQIGEGTYIGKNAVINADARIGKMCIINNGAIVEHDCEVGDFTHIAVGTVICGMSKIGQRTFAGANATIIQGVTIGRDVKIGAGATVLSNISDNCTAYGVWKGVQR